MPEMSVDMVAAMPVTPTPGDIALRIALACVAGALIGFNRESRNQAAGLRTTLLVCLAACLAMILANLLLATSGKQPGSFAQLDPLRLPLGILSGIGFLGAGAIMRRGDAILGVTTAATLWFMTVVGLCFGAGAIALGSASTLLGLAVIWGLKLADERMHHKQRGSLHLSAEREKLPETQLRDMLDRSGYGVVSWAITYTEAAARYEIAAELEWRGGSDDRTRSPQFLEAVAAAPGVLKAEWTPQALSA